ncbi:iron ABC transporter substrate-binding protein [Consotaella aegiceratis]|uniref:iron ABC transporter substrate-binding protein n=1 Tax=Consotaella aegiceratis TaxID=3097961 RepID=UPI002F3F00E5
MAINTTAESRFFIGPVINSDDYLDMTAEDAITAFEAIADNDWTEVEEVEDFGEHGDTSEEVTFTAVKNARVRKLKGPRNAGTKTVVVGRDPLDPGQQDMAAAEGTKFNYAFKTIHADAPDDTYSSSIEYFGGMVMSKAVNQGNVSNVTRRTFAIGVNTAIYEVLPAVIP